MTARRARLGALALAAGLALTTAAPATPAHAAPPGADAVVAFVVRGTGNGHGRGMSQWGSLGRALAGQSYEEILDAYYQGTRMGTRTGNVRVRLLGWDGSATLGVISRPGQAAWSGGGGAGGTAEYRSLYAIETAPNRFTVYGSTTDFACPGAATVPVPEVPLAEGSTGPDVNALQQFLTQFGYEPGGIDNQFGPKTRDAVVRFQADRGLAQDGTWDAPDWEEASRMVAERGGSTAWTELATDVAGPIVFTTSVSQANGAPGDVLGACRADGGVRHYRGRLELHDTPSGNRVVNQVGVENYLRGVVPQESPASWGDAGEGAGMNALRAQAVAARSYGLALDRSKASGYHGVARTCDSTSCQVYAGAATRASAASANSVRVEDGRTDEAIHETAGEVREWPDGSLVVTEFSASNGPRTAGGAFPAVDDPYDDQPGNPNHTWTRIIDADTIASRYGLARADAVRTAPSASMAAQGFSGIWANEVVLGNGDSVSAWDFRNAFGLRSPGFELIPVRRGTDGGTSFAFIGDSVGVGIAGDAGSPLRTLLDGAHSAQRFDSRGGRPTGGGTPTWDDGTDAAAKVPVGTDLVVVELGYNDSPSAMPQRIAAVMTALRARQVGKVLWATVSERHRTTDYAATNAALRAAAREWPELTVIDWHAASAGRAADRWFATDQIHLSATGNAEFSLWLYEQIVGASVGRRVRGGQRFEVPVLGQMGIPDGTTAGAAGVAGVALNVTAVLPTAPGHIVVWDCAGERPDTSSVNFMRAGAVEPNAVIVAFAPESEGKVCLEPYVDTDVIVDVAGWFGLVAPPPVAEPGAPPPTTAPPEADPPTTDQPDPDPGEPDDDAVEPEPVAPLHPATGRLVDTRDSRPLPTEQVLRVPVLGRAGVPAGASAGAAGVAGVALNVTSVLPAAPGHLVVWDCAAEMPDTSSVNYIQTGGVEPNAVIVPLGADSAGEVCVYAYRATDVIVDLAGWFAATVHPAAVRVHDTRRATRLGAGKVLEVPVAGTGPVPAADAPDRPAGVALNITAVDPAAAGHLTVWDCSTSEPRTSSVNYSAPGTVEPNAVLVPFAPGSSGTVCVRTYAETDVVVDLAGWFDAGLEPAAGRLVDTRYGIGPRP